MRSETMQKGLNEQLNAELYSAYLYVSMSGFCQSRNLSGMANWFGVQAQEELVHASKFFSYIYDRGGLVQLAEIAKPPSEWESPLATFETAYKHEVLVSGRIHKLLELARKENDAATESFLQWFVTEQVEEESSVSEIVGQLKLIGTSGSGIFILDRELGKRSFALAPGAA